MTRARSRPSRRRRTLPRFTDRLTLGASELRVSPICLGCSQTPEAVVAAFDAGPLSPTDEQYLIDLADLDAGRATLT